VGLLPAGPDIRAAESADQRRPGPRGPSAGDHRFTARGPAFQHLLRRRRSRGHLRPGWEDPLPQPDRW